MSIEKYYNADQTDLETWMWMNEPDKIKTYIEGNYTENDYDGIFSFLNELVVSIVMENIEEGVDSHWSKDSKLCYQSLVDYYTKLQKEDGEKIKYKKRFNTKGSLIQMDR
jgi:hypothetical protein